MSLRVIAIRHAEPISEGYAEDGLRPISERGKSVQRSVILQLKKRSILPTKIYTSPLLRAVQTADLVGQAFGLKPKIIDFLGVQFNGDELIDLLRSESSQATIVFVGHAPTLAQFINAICDSYPLPEGLQKSSSACVFFPDEIGYGLGKFQWVIHP